MIEEPPVWDLLFHQCAFAAFMEELLLYGGDPSSEAVKRRAYALYEAELRRLNSPATS